MNYKIKHLHLFLEGKFDLLPKSLGVELVDYKKQILGQNVQSKHNDPNGLQIGDVADFGTLNYL